MAVMMHLLSPYCEKPFSGLLFKIPLVSLQSLHYTIAMKIKKNIADTYE